MGDPGAFVLAGSDIPSSLCVCARGRDDILGGVGSVVHEQQLKVLDVADEEGLVARGGQVAGLLVGAEADLSRIASAPPFPTRAGVPAGLAAAWIAVARTVGILVLPLKRRRTRLSIPLGLRQLRSRHLNRSLW